MLVMQHELIRCINEKTGVYQACLIWTISLRRIFFTLFSVVIKSRIESSVRPHSSEPSAVLTQALWQEVLNKLGMISNVQHAVDASIHQLLLLVPQILTDVLRDKHDVALHVDHKKEAIQGLRGEGKVRGQRRQGEGDEGKG